MPIVRYIRSGVVGIVVELQARAKPKICAESPALPAHLIAISDRFPWYMESKIETVITTMKKRPDAITMYPAASILTIIVPPDLSFAEYSLK
ncbi:hypothetical protein ALQ24_200088 [Pseudomonas syringae pv. antirrhini]|nr:hypothetical protein ALQ24_200088 [Pseudomonas syringae pv. antirrhini]